MILRIRVGSCVVCVDASAAEQVCDVVRRAVRRAKDAGILGPDVEEGFCVLRKGAAEVPRDATVKAAGVYPGDPLRLKQQLVAPVKKAGLGAAAGLPGKRTRVGAARAPAAVSVAAAAAAVLPFPAPSESSVSNSFLPEDSDDDAGDAATSSGDVCNSPEPLLSAAASPSHGLSPMAPAATAARARRQALGGGGGGGGGGGSVRALSPPPPLQPLSLQPLSHPGSPASSTSTAVRAKRAGKAELLAPLRHSLGADAAGVVGVLPASALSPQSSAAAAAAGRGIRVRLPDGRVVKLRNMTHQCSVVADVLEAVRMKTGGGGGGDRLASKSGVPLEMDRTLQQCGVSSGTTVLYLPDDDDSDGGGRSAAAAARGSPTPSEEAAAAVPLLPSAQSFLPPAVPHSASTAASSATTRRLLQKTHVEASPQCQFTFCSLSPLFGPSLALPACH